MKLTLPFTFALVRLGSCSNNIENEVISQESKSEQLETNQAEKRDESDIDHLYAQQTHK